ncbi:substrate-binding periplasmic protein [Pseudoduganella namucuonensis]|nr:transporter substrate-binding domain-containing protein [Pseudoduganella namucuonensis]
MRDILQAVGRAWAAALCAAACLGHAAAAAPANAAPGGDRPIRIGLQNAIAPFVMPGHQSGMLVDVMRAALASQRVRAEFIYLPHVRMEQALRDGTADISTSAKPETSGPGAVLSRWPVTYFRNVAIAVRARVPALSGLDDLARLRVTAFRRAHEVLGPAYRAAMAGNPNYREAEAMPSASLFIERTDVIVSQRDIFHYYLSRQMPDWRARQRELVYHDVLGPGNMYWMAFRTEAQRDMFERGLAAIYASGEIDRIIERYRDEHGTTRDFFLALDCHFRPAHPKACRELTGR